MVAIQRSMIHKRIKDWILYLIKFWITGLLIFVLVISPGLSLTACH
jgi:hypothetical protein